MSVAVKQRRVYGKPLSRLAGRAVDIPKEILLEAGELILKEVLLRGKKEISAKSTYGGRGKPGVIRNQKEFLDSLKVRIRGQKTIEIYSDHASLSPEGQVNPMALADKHFDGMKPFRMTELVRNHGGKAVPLITSEGITIFRMVPLLTSEAWIHPGFLKYNFLEQGVKEGRKKCTDLIFQKVILPMVLNSDLFL
jgi:hypothetical protein